MIHTDSAFIATQARSDVCLAPASPFGNSRVSHTIFSHVLSNHLIYCHRNPVTSSCHCPPPPPRFDLPANHRTIHWLDSTIPHVQAFQAAYGWNLVTNPEQTTSYYISIAARTFVPEYLTPLPFIYFSRQNGHAVAGTLLCNKQPRSCTASLWRPRVTC